MTYCPCNSHPSRPVSCLPAVQTAPGESQGLQVDQQAALGCSCKKLDTTVMHKCTHGVELRF